MASEVGCSVRCGWCGRLRWLADAPLGRVFCRATPCAFAQELLDLFLAEERSASPRPAWSRLVWGELVVLTRQIPRGPQVLL